MIKSLKFILTAVIFLLLPDIAGAVDIGTFTYDLDNDNLTAIITGLVGGSEAASGDIVIPESVEYEGSTYSVSEIGKSAFSYCRNLTGSLTIPNSVTKIGASAFFDCRGFTGSLTIGNSVTEIGISAFNGCSGFTGVTSLNPVAPNCQNEETFLGIYNRVLRVPDESLEDYKEAAGWKDFSNVIGLSDIVPIEVEIGQLTYILDENNFTATLTGVVGGNKAASGELVISESVKYDGTTYSVTKIGAKAFFDCRGFTGSLIIPNSVKSIGEMAFENCNNITGGLTIGNSVTSIGNRAFYYCYGFTGSLTIPNSVISIGKDAFYHCAGFKGGLTIGNSVTSIGDGAFSMCYGFTGSLTIPNSVTEIGEFAFFSCSGFTGNLTIGNSVTEIGKSAFYQCSGFTGSLTIPNSVTSIGDRAFSSCSGFTGNLTIGNSVTEIGSYAFSNCSGFTGSLTIPNSVTSIGEFAFSSCRGFTGSLTIGNSVKSIGYKAFSNCSGFTGSLSIPNSVTSIGSEAFSQCSGFITVISLNPIPPTLGNRVFNVDVLENATLKVPGDNIDDYKSASGWQQFNNIESITTIYPEDIEMDCDNMELTEGKTATLKAILTPENATVRTLTWGSSDETVASVDANGLVTAIKAGKATITAETTNGLSASCEVTVIAKVVTASGLILNIEEVEIIEASTLQLTATIEPEDVTDKTVTWSSSDTEVATVNANGLVTTIKPGKATITATTANGLTASCEVTVIPDPAGIDGVGSEDAQVRVEGNNIIAPEGSEIYDMKGRRVVPTNLSSGIYIVKIPKGKSVKVKVD